MSYFLSMLVGEWTIGMFAFPQARRPRAMMNLNLIPARPVVVEVERQAAENDGQHEQH